MSKALVCALLILLWPTAFAAAQEVKKVRFGYPSLGFRQGHIWVAKDEGLFAKYGLDVEPIFLRGGQLAIQALAGGRSAADEHRPSRTGQPLGFQSRPRLLESRASTIPLSSAGREQHALSS